MAELADAADSKSIFRQEHRRAGFCTERQNPKIDCLSRDLRVAATRIEAQWWKIASDTRTDTGTP